MRDKRSIKGKFKVGRDGKTILAYRSIEQRKGDLPRRLEGKEDKKKWMIVKRVKAKGGKTAEERAQKMVEELNRDAEKERSGNGRGSRKIRL